MLSLNSSLIRTAFSLVIFGFASAVAAEPILTLESDDGNTVIELTGDDLLALDQHEILTENDFVDGMASFVGPLARDVLMLLVEDAGSFDAVETATLTAVNDYSVEVPIQDFLDYDVIFALTQNGDKLSRRDKGPIWLVYPMSEHEELQTPLYNDRMIWQLVRASVE